MSTRYLRQRGQGGIWYLRYKAPGRAKEINTSLKTREKRVAVRIRDRIISSLQFECVTRELTLRLLAETRRSDDRATSILADIAPKYLRETDSRERFDELAKLFIETKHSSNRIKKKISYDYERHLAIAQAIMGNKPIYRYTKEDLIDLSKRVLTVPLRLKVEQGAWTTTGTVRTISRTTAFLIWSCVCSFFSWCEQNGYVTKSQAAGIDGPRPEKEPTAAIPLELADTLCNLPLPKNTRTKYPVLSEEWAALPLFLRYTGGRISEVAGLCKADVKTADGIRFFDMRTLKTKNRRSSSGEMRRRVPVHPRLNVVLDPLLQRDEERLFGSCGAHKEFDAMRYGHYFSYHWSRQAKIIFQKAKVHSWRSFAITWMRNKGVPEDMRKELAGHVRSSVHDGYAQEAQLRVLLEAISQIP